MQLQHYMSYFQLFHVSLMDICAWGDDALQSVPHSGYWRNKPLTEEKTVRSVHRKNVKNLLVFYFIEAARGNYSKM